MPPSDISARPEQLQPLLPRVDPGQDVERGALLEGSAVKIEQIEQDVQLALQRYPREAVKWIEEFSCIRLGAFKVQASWIRDLQEKDALRTFGAQNKEIDWKHEWHRRLCSGASSPAEAHRIAMVEVEAYVVNIRNPAGADDSGILNPLLHCYQDQICGLRAFSFPAVQAVMHHKWRTWARAFLTAEVACYLVWLVSFQIFVLLVQDEDSRASLPQISRSARGIFSIIFECLAIVAMLPFVFIEYCTAREYGCKDWYTAWNSLDILAYVAQIAITIMHLGRLGIHSNAFSILAAVQVLLLWVKVQYFARCVQPTKNPFMETLRAVISDVKWFLALLLLTLWGFSCSFYILFRKDQEKQEFSTIWMSLSTMFSTMMGGFDLMLYAKSHNPIVATALLLVFVFSMSMVLLNCLIAIMCQACEKVNDTEGNVFLLARAQIIDELETTVPITWRRETWYPKYIHFLQINREHALLQEVGALEEEGDGANATQQRIDDLETKLLEAQAQISKLLTLQQALVKHLLPKDEAHALLGDAPIQNGVKEEK